MAASVLQFVVIFSIIFNLVNYHLTLHYTIIITKQYKINYISVQYFPYCVQVCYNIFPKCAVIALYLGLRKQSRHKN